MTWYVKMGYYIHGMLHTRDVTRIGCYIRDMACLLGMWHSMEYLYDYVCTAYTTCKLVASARRLTGTTSQRDAQGRRQQRRHWHPAIECDCCYCYMQGMWQRRKAPGYRGINERGWRDVRSFHYQDQPDPGRAPQIALRSDRHPSPLHLESWQC